MGFDISGIVNTVSGFLPNKDDAISFGSVGKTSLTSYLNLEGGFKSLGNQLSQITSKNVLNGVQIPHVYKSGATIKGYLLDALDSKNKRKFQYNPRTMDYERSATYAQIKAPGMQYPLIYFVSGEVKKFDLELFIVDHPTTGKINEDIQWCESFLPKYKNDELFSNPRPIIYAYGNYVCKCVVESVKTHIEEYDASGDPWLATLTLSMLVVDAPQYTAPSSDIPANWLNTAIKILR